MQFELQRMRIATHLGCVAGKGRAHWKWAVLDSMGIELPVASSKDLLEKMKESDDSDILQSTLDVWIVIFEWNLEERTWAVRDLTGSLEHHTVVGILQVESSWYGLRPACRQVTEITAKMWREFKEAKTSLLDFVKPIWQETILAERKSVHNWKNQGVKVSMQTFSGTQAEFPVIHPNLVVSEDQGVSRMPLFLGETLQAHDGDGDWYEPVLSGDVSKSGDLESVHSGLESLGLGDSSSRGKGLAGRQQGFLAGLPSTVVVRPQGAEPKPLSSFEFEAIYTWVQDYRLTLRLGNDVHPQTAISEAVWTSCLYAWDQARNKTGSEVIAVDTARETLSATEWLSMFLRVVSLWFGRTVTTGESSPQIPLTLTPRGVPEIAPFFLKFNQLYLENPNQDPKTFVRKLKEGIKDWAELYASIDDKVAELRKQNNPRIIPEVLGSLSQRFENFMQFLPGFQRALEREGKVFGIRRDTTHTSGGTSQVVRNGPQAGRKRPLEALVRAPPKSVVVKPKRCTKCGKSGHLYQECTSEVDLKLCKICFQPNHYAESCPQRVTTGSSTSQLNKKSKF